MKKRSRVIITILIVLLIGITLHFLHSSPKGEAVTISVEKGASARSIAAQLDDEGIVRSKSLFLLYVKMNGGGSGIQAGKHEFQKGMKYSECLKELTSSADFDDSVTITVPEGYEAHQIADLLEKKGICDSTAFMDAAKNHTFDYPFLTDLPDREMPLEGYLFPDTYEFCPNTDPDVCIRTMLGQFEKKLYTKENQKRAEDMGYTFDEIVTMASIVEREAAGDIDRAKVASVFYNRMDSDYNYLESCATVQYILGERKTVLTYEDTKINSPYNTYINRGLPIGPIASPGELAFEAALYPADTEYKYFVVGKNGEHVFSKTYEEHLKAQE